MRHDVVWTSTSLESTEDCIIHEQPTGVALSSSTTLRLDDNLGRIDYELEADAAWHTLGATITVSGRADRRITIERGDAGWAVDGEHRPDLDACIDLDLGWTPATNILPLRRTSLGVGASVETTAAWLRFPELDLVVAQQTYTRTGPRTVVYRSATFEAELAITEAGIVTRYGDDLWIGVVG